MVPPVLKVLRRALDWPRQAALGVSVLLAGVMLPRLTLAQDPIPAPTPAPVEATEITELSGSLETAHAGVDVTLWGLFLQADLVVKIVMLLLLLASVWCWAIIFNKLTLMRRVNRDADGFEDEFWSGGSLEDLYDRVGANPPDAMSAVFASAMKEWRHATDRGLASNQPLRASIQQRIDKVMDVTVAREMASMEKGMTFLASVGSTAPFIGLFGTVWGIMNAFVAIAATANTSLAVVAPGIAEALFATALGLFAAIPASAAYNKFTNDLSKFAERLESFAGEFSAILGRYLEERG